MLKIKIQKLAEALLKDDAATTGQSYSSILEAIILRNYVSALWVPIIEMMYQQNLSIEQTLELVWIRAADMDLDDMLPVVRYSAKVAQLNGTVADVSSSECQHFKLLLGSIATYIGIEKKEYLRHQAIITDLRESYITGIKISLSTVYCIIINTWDILKNKAKTYNTLQCLAELSKEGSYRPEDRLELLKILNTIGIAESADNNILRGGSDI